MASQTKERLHSLLPAIYRLRDVEQGEPLRALLAVIETEFAALESDIAGLYANWFIETAEEWVVPYIGDLLASRPLHSVSAGTYSRRAYVANTLAYRRRKGTASMLEQLARDVTGWPARAVEFFELLATTQHVNHPRAANLRTPDLRDPNEMDLLDTPFDSAAHTGEVRRIASGRGKYNIPNIGLFMWRLQSYPVERGTARAVGTDGRYTFSPLGYDAPLFNNPQTETDITHLAEEINVPGELRRRALHDDLEAYRQALVDGQTPHGVYFGDQPVVRIYTNGQTEAIPTEEVDVCDLSSPPASPDDWRRPPATKSYTTADGLPATLPIQVGFDPVLGRLAFRTDEVPAQVEVSYSYGFSSDVGGGPYDRRESVDESLTREVGWQVGVGKSAAAVGGEHVFDNLQAAVEAWNDQPAGTAGVIAVLDSATYEEDLTGVFKIVIPEGSQLTMVAADWPAVDVADSPGQQQRSVGRLAAEGLRPHVQGSIEVEGTGPDDSSSSGELVLNGLLVEGSVTVLPGGLGSLQLSHCTLVPGEGGLVVDPAPTPGGQHASPSISIDRSICDKVDLPVHVTDLLVEDSVVSSGAESASGAPAVVAPGAAADVRRSTVFGAATVRSLEAENSIFTGAVTATRRQIGCVRFSYVAEGSSTPRRYHCQPDLALRDVSDVAERDSIRTRLRPTFTSIAYGDPAYAQLSGSCAEELRTGDEDGSEMGVFSHLQQQQREINLRTSLDEYLRFGLQAGIFYST